MGIAVSELNKTYLNCACGLKFKKGNLALLRDIKGYTGRKIYYKWCPNCKKLVLTLIEHEIKTGKIYVNENITGAAALKILAREQKRKITIFPDIKNNSLYGWIYGHNVQIKNKKGEITQIRQYASDFKGNKFLTKKIICK